MVASGLAHGWYPCAGLVDRDGRIEEPLRSVTSGRVADHKVRSPLLPGGDLVGAVLNRQVMGLADRGGASGLVGRRWADLCAAWAEALIGRTAHVPFAAAAPFVVDRVARLDDAPRIASVASRRGLQNPDIVIIGERDGRSVLQAADAKFSVETARSKQVSPEVVEALLTLGPLVRSLTGELTEAIEFVPGVFLSPDFPLTHLMLGGRQGITRATVRPTEVVFVPVDPAGFFAPLPAAAVMPVLAAVDALPVTTDASLLAGLYYFRLARAAVGAWMDSVKPLLLFNDLIELDEAAVLAEAQRRAAGARSAFQLILDWDADTESVRARRAAVDQVTSLPVMTRDLRNAIAAVVGEDIEAGPSVNQVRRKLGAWFRSELRAAFGPMYPDEPDFAERLRELGKLSAQFAKAIPERTDAIVRELVVEKAALAVDGEANELVDAEAE